MIQNCVRWSWLPTKMATKLKIEKKGGWNYSSWNAFFCWLTAFGYSNNQREANVKTKKIRTWWTITTRRQSGRGIINTFWGIGWVIGLKFLTVLEEVGIMDMNMTRLSLTLDPMGISHFHLFFWNHKTDLNQTWRKCSLDGHIQDFCFWHWSEIQHGCQGP